MADNLLWRVQVKCHECDYSYQTRAKDKKTPPDRCKNCRSARIDLDLDVPKSERFQKVTHIP